MKLSMLIVDDDEVWTKTFCDNLKNLPIARWAGDGYSGYTIHHVTNQHDAERAVSGRKKRDFDMVLLDLNYPMRSRGKLRLDPRQTLQGMKWLPQLRRLQPRATIVILTAWAYERDFLNAVEAIRDWHANDFVPKTASFADIATRMFLAIQNARQKRKLMLLEREGRFLGRNGAIRIYEQDVADLLTNLRHLMERTARRIESGDPSAIASAPETIRNEFSSATKEFDALTSMVDRRLTPGETRLESVDLVVLVNDLLLQYDSWLEDAKASGAGPDSGQKAVVTTFAQNLKVALHEVIANGIESLEHSKRKSLSRTLRISVTKEKRAAVITVEDTGDGFSNSALSNMFKLGFTTRNKTQHPGMGLYIARKMMNAIGGEIRAENTARGAKVRLVIPSI